MNKIKIITYSLIVLVILNLGIIAFFMIIKPRAFGDPRNGPRKMIISKLDLDEKQQQKFEILVTNHIKKIKAIENNVQQTKQVLYTQLSKPQIDQHLKDSLITQLGKLQMQIETDRFYHFKRLQNLCNTPEQKENFKELAVELSKMFTHKGMRKPCAKN